MGRILRDSSGRIAAIVEQRDCDPTQTAIREVNLGIYRFQTAWLWPQIDALHGRARTTNTHPNERYLTDILRAAAADGRATAVPTPLPDGRLNVETLSDIARAERIMRRRIAHHLLACGVALRDPDAVWIDATAQVAPGAVIEPGSHLRGQTRIGAHSRVGPNAVLTDAVLGEHCSVESCTIRASTLADHVEVGPYSTIRPGCQIDNRVHIGSTVELKSAVLREEVQIGHFSYVGDAEIGARANIGAGSITCNFDGQHKHRTVVGEDAFIGSDSLLIPPVQVGHRARTGAGAVVTKDVPDDATVVGHPARLTARAERSHARRNLSTTTES